MKNLKLIFNLQLTDELEQSFDRRGRRLEPIKSALDLHRERFAQRMEKSTADRTRYLSLHLHIGLFFNFTNII
jgi:hypothetical protein